LAANAFSRLTVFSSGGGGGVKNFTTAGLWRLGFAVNVIPCSTIGQGVSEFTLIRIMFLSVFE